MKSLIQRTRVTIPGAVLSLLELTAVPECASDTHGFGRHNPQHDPALRVDFRVIFSRLVGCCGFPVVFLLVGLSQASLDEKQRGDGNK